MEVVLTLYCCEAGHAHVGVRAGGALAQDQIVGSADLWPLLKAICRDELGRFAPCGGANRPGGGGGGRERPGDGGAAGRARRERAGKNLEKARELIKGIKDGPHPVSDSKVKELHDHLGTMTVAQMRQVAKEHDLTVTGKLKKDLQDRIAAKFNEPRAKPEGDKPKGTKPKDDSPRPDADIPAGTFGTPKNLKWDTAKEDVAFLAERILGKGTTGNDLAAVCGVPNGSRVWTEPVLVPGGQGAILRFSGSKMVRDPQTGKMTKEEYLGARTLTRKADGSKSIHNDLFEGKGSGLGMFGRQVENAAKHGFSKIDTDAAGFGGGVTGQRNPNSPYNGYYTWPRFGYDGKIPPAVLGKLPPGLKADVERHGGKVSGLMETKAGRDWWLGHGKDINVTFDLRPGSYSQRTLLDNLKERGIVK